MVTSASRLSQAESRPFGLIVENVDALYARAMELHESPDRTVYGMAQEVAVAVVLVTVVVPELALTDVKV